MNILVTRGSTFMDKDDYFRFYMEVGASICIANGYAVFKYQGKQYLLHRWIMNAKPGQEVSHLDGNPLNNSKSNLKICSRSENFRNLNDKLQSNNLSGFRGVSWHKKTQKWIATINIGGEKIHLGCFDTAEEAHAAYQRAAERLGYISKIKETV